MLGAEDALGVGQISVFMCDTGDEPDRERRYLATTPLLSRQVDGLIVAGALDSSPGRASARGWACPWSTR